MTRYVRKSPEEVEKATQERIARWLRLGRIGKLMYGCQAFDTISQDESMPMDIRVQAAGLFKESQKFLEAYRKELHVKSFK